MRRILPLHLPVNVIASWPVVCLVLIVLIALTSSGIALNALKSYAIGLISCS